MILSSVHRCAGWTLHTPAVSVRRSKGSNGSLVVRTLGCAGCAGCFGNLSREHAHTPTSALDSSAYTPHTLHTGGIPAESRAEKPRNRKTGVQGVSCTPLHAPAQEVTNHGR